jgi:hypothetical protein
LTPSDETGTSDAYVIARCAGASQRTVTKQKMNSPRWYTSLCLDVDLAQPLTLAPDLQIVVCRQILNPPPLFVRVCVLKLNTNTNQGANLFLYAFFFPEQVMDEDQLLDDMIGRCGIKVGRLQSAMPQSPKWYNIHAYSHDSEGQVLMSFQLIPVEDLAKSKLTSIVPKTRECIVEVQCLGVRGMLPFKLASISEPQLIFSVGEKVDNNKATKRTKFSSKPNGANANFLEVLAINVAIPDNPMFAPALDLTCMDKRLTGEEQVATATYWLGKFLPWTTKDDLDSYNTVEVSDDEGEDRQGAVEQLDIPLDIEQWNEEVVDAETLAGIDEFVKLPEDKTKKAKRGKRTIPDVSATDLNPEDGKEEEDDEDDKKKHQKNVEQPVIDDELETTLSDVPFSNLLMFRGQGEDVRTVGAFKGNIMVFEVAHRHKIKAINVKELFKPRQLRVRVYIIRGINLAPANKDGSADPYISVILGDGKSDTKAANSAHDAQEDTLEPDFYKAFELTGVIPGNFIGCLSQVELGTVTQMVK